ncbi:MAG: hypothetical protein IID36_03950 [Planctomycetes bacterium]|nr:hypothetical protein [Planctomycetota bacterium]
MNRKTYGQRFVRMLATAAMGGSIVQLSGCDPAVRDTLLVGLQSTTQSLSGALIDAFFISLADDEAEASGFTTTG